MARRRFQCWRTVEGSNYLHHVASGLTKNGTTCGKTGKINSETDTRKTQTWQTKMCHICLNKLSKKKKDVQ